MLSESTAYPVLAVTDLDRARGFYENTLGFSAVGEGDGGVFYGAGGSAFFVYPSSYAGTNKATGITFEIPSERFDAEVGALRDHGVTFQTFDVPQEAGQWQDGVLVSPDGMRAAWFADPDGNILNVSTPVRG